METKNGSDVQKMTVSTQYAFKYIIQMHWRCVCVPPPPIPFILFKWSGMVWCICTIHIQCALVKKSRHVTCIFWLNLNIIKKVVNDVTRMTKNWSFSNIVNIVNQNKDESVTINFLQERQKHWVHNSGPSLSINYDPEEWNFRSMALSLFADLYSNIFHSFSLVHKHTRTASLPFYWNITL